MIWLEQAFLSTSSTPVFMPSSLMTLLLFTVSEMSRFGLEQAFLSTSSTPVFMPSSLMTLLLFTVFELSRFHLEQAFLSRSSSPVLFSTGTLSPTGLIDTSISDSSALDILFSVPSSFSPDSSVSFFFRLLLLLSVCFVLLPFCFFIFVQFHHYYY